MSELLTQALPMIGFLGGGGRRWEALKLGQNPGSEITSPCCPG